MAKRVMLDGDIVEVAMPFVAKPGDKLLIVNGICLGLYSSPTIPVSTIKQSLDATNTKKPKGSEYKPKRRRIRKFQKERSEKTNQIIKQIKDYLKPGMSLTAQEIADELHIDRKDRIRAEISRILRMLIDDGYLKRFNSDRSQFPEFQLVE